MPKKTESKTKREIDWQEIHEQIARNKLNLDTLTSVSTEERERIWKERARQFARVPEQETAGEVTHLAIIQIGRELCAFDVDYIESIRSLEEVTRVPRTPSWLTGIANLRGQIYSVTDLQKFLHLHNGQESDSLKGELVLVKNRDLRLALRVDEVRAVETIPNSRIHAAADTIHGIKPEFINGVIDDYQTGETEKTPVLVLNMNALLQDESIYVREEFA